MSFAYSTGADMAEGGEREPREVKNHILFEIATEVAHRGMTATDIRKTVRSDSLTDTPSSSWRYLLRHQIESSRYDGRIWRPLHLDWSAQSYFCKLGKTPTRSQPASLHRS